MEPYSFYDLRVDSGAYQTIDKSDRTANSSTEEVMTSYVDIQTVTAHYFYPPLET